MDLYLIFVKHRIVPKRALNSIESDDIGPYLLIYAIALHATIR